MPISLMCEECGNAYITRLSRIGKRKHCSIKCKNISRELKLPQLTERQLQIINGCLLGDGSIARLDGKHNNTYFNETHCIKHEEYLVDLSKEFGEWRGVVSKSMKYSRVVFQSRRHRFWTELRNKWYPNGFKIVPQDLILTPLTLSHWYVGDGCNSYYNIKLCTHGFSIHDVKFLIRKLNDDLDVKARLFIENRNEKQYPLIYINASHHERFIKLMEPHITWSCFQYKMEL